MNAYLAWILKSLHWMLANYKWLVPVIVAVVANAANAMLQYPETSTLGHEILDRVAILQRYDSPGTLKLLGKRSNNPRQGLVIPAVLSNDKKEDDAKSNA